MSGVARGPYRDEGRPVEKPEYVPVHRDRLAHLRRCEEVLDMLDEHAALIDGEGPGRRPWHVELYTGDQADVFPVLSEGEGLTLREAVENAAKWERVPVRHRPEQGVVERRLAFMTFLAVLGWLGAFAGMVL